METKQRTERNITPKIANVYINYAFCKYIWCIWHQRKALVKWPRSPSNLNVMEYCVTFASLCIFGGHPYMMTESLWYTLVLFPLHYITIHGFRLSLLGMCTRISIICDVWTLATALKSCIKISINLMIPLDATTR